MDGAAPTYGGADGRPGRQGSNFGLVWAIVVGVLVVVGATAGMVALTLASARRPSAAPAGPPSATVSASATPTVAAYPMPAAAETTARDFLTAYVAADPARRNGLTAAAAAPLAQRLLAVEARPTVLDGPLAGRQASLGATAQQKLGRGTTVTLTLGLDGTSPSGWRVIDAKEE